MRTQRQLRVGEEIRHALAAVLQRGDVPWVGDFRPAFITVTEVQVSPDLRNATVFVMPLGGQNIPATIKALNAILGFFRHELSRAVKLRYVPALTFKPDNSFDYAHRIDSILHNPAVAKDLKDE
jgi:ribosome-binding factor A